MWQPMLAVFGGSLAFAHTLMSTDDIWQPAKRSYDDNLLQHPGLSTRGATQCGPAYNNQVCDPGQCCSANGQCGTGTSYCTAPDCQFQWGPGCDANQIPPGTNTTSLSRPKFGNVPYGTNIFHCNTPGKVALTFDDGPYLYTNDLLDLLKTNNVKATFFMVANNLAKGQIELDSTGWPTVMKRVFNEGHQIASHTWSHQSLDALTPQQVTDQIVKNEIAFSDVFGFFPTYIRPPYGFCSSATCQTTLGNLGYHIINWDIDTLDWQENYPASQAIFSSAIKSSNPSTNSFIPLTHDIHYGTVHGFVQFMLDTLHAAGYTTALIGECLNDPRQNWYRDATTGQPWSSSVAAPQPAVASTPPAPSSTQQTTTTSQAQTSSSSSSGMNTSTSRSTSTSPSSTSASTSTSTSTTSTSSAAPVSTSSMSTSTSHLQNVLTSISTTSNHISLSGCTGVGGCIIQGLNPTTTTVPAYYAMNATVATSGSAVPSTSSSALAHLLSSATSATSASSASSASPTSASATAARTGAASRIGVQGLTWTLAAVLLAVVNVR